MTFFSRFRIGRTAPRANPASGHVGVASVAIQRRRLSEAIRHVRWRWHIAECVKLAKGEWQ